MPSQGLFVFFLDAGGALLLTTLSVACCFFPEWLSELLPKVSCERVCHSRACLRTMHAFFALLPRCVQALTEVIKVVARKHGVQFVEFPSFSAALWKHFRHLVAVNDSPVHGARGKDFLRQNRIIAKALSE